MILRSFFWGIWPLFIGLFFIMAGNSIQGSLIAYRVGLSDYSYLTAGLIISGYCLGMLTSVFSTSYFVKSVGHVRVFAALTATVSAAMLIFPLLVHPLIWFLLRFMIGFCYVGLYIVTEVWINALTTNAFRGRVMSFYVMTQLVGYIFGQFLLRFTTPESATLFLVASIGVSLAAVPMLMIKVVVPPQPESNRIMSLKQLYSLSPFASMGTILIGMQQIVFYASIGFFAQKANMSLKQLSLLTTLILLAGIITQWPLARISDMIDRRTVIMISSLLAAILCALGAGLDINNITAIFVISFAIALCVIPLYAVNLAHANDVIPAKDIVAAGSTIQMLNAMGAVAGPLFLSFFMSRYDAPGFFVYVAFISLLIAIYALYRKNARTVTVHHQAVITPFLQLRSALRDPRKFLKETDQWDISKHERPQYHNVPIIDAVVDKLAGYGSDISDAPKTAPAQNVKQESAAKKTVQKQTITEKTSAKKTSSKPAAKKTSSKPAAKKTSTKKTIGKNPETKKND